MNITRPKSNVHKRERKHKSVARKMAIMEQRRLALLGKTAPVKTVAPKKETPVAEKPAKTPVKKAAAKKPVASAPAARVRKPRAKKAAPAA